MWVGLSDHVGSEAIMNSMMSNAERIAANERFNSGTSWTNNEEFDKNGYLVVKNLWDPKELECPVPMQRGQFHYFNKNYDDFSYEAEEAQVKGSTSRYWFPQYRTVHTGIRLKLEKIIGRKLYNTYYYDRFYFNGQKLESHTDRDACEISVTIHVRTSLEGKEAEWPIWIKTPDIYTDSTKKEIKERGENRSAILHAGDAMIYKGCERPHWREEIPSPKRRKRDILLWRKKEYYYHQIFFHYVLQDGRRAHCAWDRAR